MNYNTQKQEIANLLRDNIDALKSPNIKACILYGSVALGRAKKESDIDIMLLFDYTDAALLNKIKGIRDAIEQKHAQQLSIGFQTVSSFLSNMMEGHQMFINICLKGTCLKNSVVFRGLKNIIVNSTLPSKEEIIKARKTIIQSQTANFFGPTMTEFVAKVDAMIRAYVHFQEYKTSVISSWEEYENLIDHQNFFPLIETHLPEHVVVLKSFYSSKDLFNATSPHNATNMQSLDFPSLLNCIAYIQSNAD